MSKEQTPITAEQWLKDNYKIYPFDSKELALDIHANRCEIYSINLCNMMEQYAQHREKKAVQEALSPIIEECKTVIDNPNQLETTKGFASMIWYELQNAHQTNNYE